MFHFFIIPILIVAVAGFFLAQKYVGPYQDRLAAWDKEHAKDIKTYKDEYNIRGSVTLWCTLIFIVVFGLLVSLQDLFR